MLSLVRVGKEWTSQVFLHPDNHLHKVDALSCQGGERMGRPKFPHPLKNQDCMHIHDRVWLIFSLFWGMGKEWAGPVFLHPDFHLQKVDASLFRVGKEWAVPMFPHPNN